MPLIKVGLIRGLWFIPPAYISRPQPPLKAPSHLIKSSEPETLVSLELHHILGHSYIV
jgi:hypothetical protein